MQEGKRPSFCEYEVTAEKRNNVLCRLLFGSFSVRLQNIHVVGRIESKSIDAEVVFVFFAQGTKFCEIMGQPLSLRATLRDIYDPRGFWTCRVELQSKQHRCNVQLQVNLKLLRKNECCEARRWADSFAGNEAPLGTHVSKLRNLRPQDGGKWGSSKVDSPDPLLVASPRVEQHGIRANAPVNLSL